MPLSAPVLLSEHHVLDRFRCTSPELTAWLLRRGRRNHEAHVSRCFVVADEHRTVVGYYALSAGSIARHEVPSSIGRNMPDPIPVALLGRLAVHENYTGQGIGQGMLKDAILRTAAAAQELGIRALLCHAISDGAKDFYLRHGFVESPVHPLTVMLPIRRIIEIASEE